MRATTVLVVLVTLAVVPVGCGLVKASLLSETPARRQTYGGYENALYSDIFDRYETFTMIDDFILPRHHAHPTRYPRWYAAVRLRRGRSGRKGRAITLIPIRRRL